MRFYLLQTKINGIKSIKKEITIEYYNNTVDKELDIMNNHVKAIYGPNGAGKTGIVYAMEIYKNINIVKSYLPIVNANASLRSLINENNELFIENIFACVDSDDKVEDIYKHRIVLKDINGSFEISNEFLGKLSGNKINLDNKYKTIYEIKDGEIISLISGIKNESLLRSKTQNLLKYNSFITTLLDTKYIDIIDETLNYHYLRLVLFNLSIRVVLQDSDKPYINISNINSMLKQIDKIKSISDEETFNLLLSNNKILDNSTLKINKKDIDAFERKIKNTSEFIKVFKPDLKDIEVKKYENKDYYECELIMIYDNNVRVNSKFESTGIKKIIEIYGALSDIEKGNIVFIDEFDANIHDVLLQKIVEYIIEYTNGQFVFTIHNLTPMDILQYKKHGIDFLSLDSKLVSWKKNGNYKASSLYRQGFIEYSQFNIEAFSFLGKFGNGKWWSN